MEKRITRSIISLLVIVALSIIISPLIFNKSETSSTLQSAADNTPAFPNQASPNENGTSAQENTLVALVKKIFLPHEDSIPTLSVTATQTNNIASESTSTTLNTITTTPITTAEQATTDTNAQPTETLVNTAENTEVCDPTKPQETIVIDSEETDSSAAETIQALVTEATTPKAQTPVPTVTETTTEAKAEVKTPIPNKTVDLDNLKKTAWVVQVGSFKNTENAKRLTNALREKGFKAFTYETKSNGQTRVYVGPAFKQATASDLAHQIEQTINMHGVIVNYQPLEL